MDNEFEFQKEIPRLITVRYQKMIFTKYNKAKNMRSLVQAIYELKGYPMLKDEYENFCAYYGITEKKENVRLAYMAYLKELGDII